MADKVLRDLNLVLLQVCPFNPALWYLMIQATTNSFASFTLLGCFHLSGMFSPNQSTVYDYIRVQLGLSLPLGRLPYTPDWAKCPPGFLEQLLPPFILNGSYPLMCSPAREQLTWVKTFTCVFQVLSTGPNTARPWRMFDKCKLHSFHPLSGL